MYKNNVYNFTSNLEMKKLAAEFANSLEVDGWTSIGKTVTSGSDLIFYLVDSSAVGMAIFGIHNNQLEEAKREGLVHWGHFVLSWDVLVDESMPHDDTHIKNTLEIFLRAFPLLPNALKISSSTEKGGRIHVVVLIDRNDMNGPVSIASVNSNLLILDESHLKTILPGIDFD